MELDKELIIANKTRPKYSELDMEEIKNKHNKEIQSLENDIAKLNEYNIIKIAGQENLIVMLTPNIIDRSCECRIHIRDCNFKIENPIVINENTIRFVIQPDNCVSERNLHKAFNR